MASEFRIRIVQLAGTPICIRDRMVQFDPQGVALVNEAELAHLRSYYSVIEVVADGQPADSASDPEASGEAADQAADQSEPEAEIKATVDLEALTIPNLRRMAEELGVELPDGFVKKAEIIAALEPVVNPISFR